MEERNPFRGRAGTGNSPLSRKGGSVSPHSKQSNYNYSLRNSGSLLKSQKKQGGYLDASVRVDDNVVPEEGEESRTDLSQQYTPANVGEKKGESNRPS